jgi:plastocyanin
MGSRARRHFTIALCGACGLLGLAVPASLLAADPPPEAGTTNGVPTTETTTTASTTTMSSTTTAPAPPTTTPQTTSVPAYVPVRARRLSAAAPRPESPARKGASSVSITDGQDPSDFGFSPSSISLVAGNTVTWTNTGSAPTGHTVTGSGFASGVIHPGNTYSHTFTTAGTFNYVCSIHPFMKGTVTVTAASPPSGGTSAGGADPTPTTPPPAPQTGPTSESAAGSSPGAAGSASTLPLTGTNALGLAAIGAAFLLVGLRLRRFGSAPA